MHGGFSLVLTARAFFGGGDRGLWFFCEQLLLGARVGRAIHKLHEAVKVRFICLEDGCECDSDMIPVDIIHDGYCSRWLLIEEIFVDDNEGVGFG